MEKEVVKLNRRGFLNFIGAAGAALITKPDSATARALKAPQDSYGCLVDLTRCIGCRKCEQACNAVNQLAPPDVPYDNLTVLDKKRRPDEKAYTVVNRYFPGKIDERDQLIPTFVKIQCMHCQDPSQCSTDR